MRGAQVPRDGKRRAMASAKSASRHRNAFALARLATWGLGGDAQRARNLDLDVGRALQYLEKAWDYGDEDTLLELDTYADSAKVLASVASTIRETAPSQLLKTNLSNLGDKVTDQVDNYGAARASRDAPVQR